MTMARRLTHTSVGNGEWFGHEAHVRAFRELAGNGLLGHAYCFFGDEGVGKFRFACALAHFLEGGAWSVRDERALSDFLIIARDAEEPRSRATKQDRSGENGAAGRASIGVDAARAVRTFLSATPFASPRRTVVVRDAEWLTAEAQSALLKIVEDPPPHALVILIARDPSVLTAPLASRTVKVYFPRLSRAVLADILESMHQVSAREASALAARAFGRLGYALALAKNKARRPDEKTRTEETLAEQLESLILARWEKNVRGESATLSSLLSRFEAASRFNLNPRLQEKYVSYIMSS
ncbi:MAG: hypothetical protein HYU81_03070 [Candidatus Brennerbacteria bacterium]|nr:hypothetical protein [Candidatus Brennerbacteria bacterium]